MTAHGQDQSDRAVEASLDAWAAASEAPTGWVEPEPAAGPSREPAEHQRRPVVEQPPKPVPPPVVNRAAEPLPPQGGAELEQPAGRDLEDSRPAAFTAKLAAHGPELLIGGAFVGGLLLASILRRLAR